MTWLCLLLALAPPELPDATADDAGTPTDPLEDNPEWNEEDADDEDDEEDAAPAPAPTLAPAPAPAPTPQRPHSPGASVPQSAPATGPSKPASAATPAPAPEPAVLAEDGWDGKPMDDAAAEDARAKENKKGKFGGLKLFRLGIAPKIGYTHGTSDKNGIFDRQKTIDASVENMQATPTGGGDLGTTRFGGPMYGFEIDLEVFFVNAWLDFHKFFRPGGMWSVLIGYDHEFGLHERVRFNLGAGFGMMRVFLGQALEDLYYDQSNPEAVNIATAGIEGRLMAGFDFKIVGPLYTGPMFMGGYHYLFSANVDEVTKEKGFHYSAAWNLKLLFELPRDW